jgi:hypothetical protein
MTLVMLTIQAVTNEDIFKQAAIGPKMQHIGLFGCHTIAAKKS